ncbi:MAG: thiamine phosphate synthase [Candidatus Omnitrophica bacterium]|nr:thiamine phosphate synthase [Candidatus Omnitrophota bacterium]
MIWKKRQLKKSRLYAILDKDLCGGNLLPLARKIIDSGVDIIQLRFKNGETRDILRFAKVLRRFSRNKALFIVNDHIDVALASGADGVHLGQEDTPIEIARKVVGDNFLIGVSCHNLRQAKIAQKCGADYVGIGPMFATSTKAKEPVIGLKVLKEIKRSIRLPSFALGGIHLGNLPKIRQYDINTIAVGKAICQAQDIEERVSRFKKLLN